jgi:hypothetical protein
VFPVVSFLLAFPPIFYMHSSSPPFVLHALPEDRDNIEKMVGDCEYNITKHGENDEEGETEWDGMVTQKVTMTKTIVKIKIAIIKTKKIRMNIDNNHDYDQNNPRNPVHLYTCYSL